MEQQQLHIIAEGGENNRVEFKECGKGIPSSAYETVVSFSNTSGGTILLGVNDDGEITGISEDEEGKLKSDLVTALNSPDCIKPPIKVQPQTTETNRGKVLSVIIPASSQVHNHAGRIYVRDEDSDIDITDNQHRLSDLYQKKRTSFTETKIYPGLTFEDLDSTLFDKARKLIRANQSDHPWALMDDKEMLEASILYKKNFTTGEDGLTLAAALIFGKDSTIQSLLPAYKVEAMVRRENLDRWDDRITLRTNLIDTYQQLKEFVYKHLPQKFHMEGDQRIDLRDIIFREVIGNAVVHREYTSALSTKLIIGKNEVTITNPNRALFHGPIDPTSFNPYPKNPNIRRFFTSFGWTDEIGSGIRNTTKWLPRYVPNAKPLFIEDDVFKTIIPLEVAQLGSYANTWVKWLELPEAQFKHIKKGLQDVLLPSDLVDGSWDEVILHLVPSWHEEGTKLKRLDWPSNQVYEEEAIREVPSWITNGTKLLHKKVRYLIRILTLTSAPISLDDMMEAIGYKNRASFRGNYLTPLEKVEFITKTIPDKPQSPDQKYVITETGRLFLGGRNRM